MPSLGDLIPDPQNVRQHNPRNLGMIERSIQEDGFGRPILLDSAMTILAGNATAEAAASAGLEDVQIIDSDGTKVIAIRRTDVAPGSTQAKRLGLADNRTAELSTWDPVGLASLNSEIDLAPFFYDPELARALQIEPAFDADDEWKGMPEFDQDDQMPLKQVIINFRSEADVLAFAQLMEQNIQMTTRSVWYPAQPRQRLIDTAWKVEPDDDAS